MKQAIRKLFSYTLLAGVLFSTTALGSCKGDKPDAPQEENLRVSLDPVPTNPVRALGASYDFAVKVESKMPKDGVSVQVDYRKDSDNSSLFSRNYPSVTTSPLSVSVQGIPFNQMGTVSVVVTSKTKATNTSTQTFKLVRK
jgi:hypothetical protein